MKGLSIRQPWAHLVVHGPKRVENRTWGTSYRGQFAIHASKGCSREEHEQAVAFVAGLGLGVAVPRYGTMALGAVIGVATLLDCLEPWQPVDGASLGLRTALGRPTLPDLRWWDQEQHGWVLGQVRPLLQPIACSGALGLWQLPIEVEQQILNQLSVPNSNS